MNLRWYQTYDKNGINSEVELQYYDAEYEYWSPVPFVREREKEEEENE